jgi:hypothetical protein
MTRRAAAGWQRRRTAVCTIGSLLGAPLVLVAALWPIAAGAGNAHAVEAGAARSARSSIILAQTFHVRPGVPGSTDSGDLGRSSDGSHAPPGVPGSTDDSHAPPQVPNFSGSGGASGGSHGVPAGSNGSGPSHAAPRVPGSSGDAGNAAAPPQAPSPAPNGPGVSHAAPGVPMMGGNP